MTSTGALAEELPMTGEANPDLAPLDRFMSAFMRKWNIPGGQCALAKDGRLIYARGFGRVNAMKPGAALPPAVSPTARFRIASSTKPITATAVMKLVEQGRLGLEDHAFEILHDLKPPSRTAPDPRLRGITVRQLLEHSAGFDNTEVDPQFNYLRSAADTFHHPRPATHVDIICYTIGQPLGFAPGTKHMYSNFGYNVLGRVIERKTELSYGDAIQRLVLNPAGVKRMTLMTRSTPEARLLDEVFYVDPSALPPMWPIYEDEQSPRSFSYGWFDGRAIDSHGGWIANAVDLTRFLNAVGGATGIQLLAASTLKTMLTRPDLPDWQGTPGYYALGWDVLPGTEMTMTGR